MQRATDDIVSGIMGRWAAAFSKLDAKALASLYSRNAFFFGSNPTFYRGNAVCRPISRACRDGSRHQSNSPMSGPRMLRPT
jgi:ketosteroid isomerase-like protein